MFRALRATAANLASGDIESLRFNADRVVSSKVFSPAMCSTLQCSRVSVVYTVSKGRKCAASKMRQTGFSEGMTRTAQEEARRCQDIA